MKTQHPVDERLESLFSETVDATIRREETALDDLLENCGKRVVLVGGGSIGTRTAKCLRTIGVEPLAFADNNPSAQGRTIDGLQVLSLPEAAERFGGETLYLTTIWNEHHWYSDTSEQLAGLGCTNVAAPSPVFWRFPETFLPFFGQDLPQKILPERDDVLRAGTLWSDDESRLEYLAHVRWRTHGDFQGLPKPPAGQCYFEDDIFAPSHDESVIDCGAFDGDTLRTFLGRYGNGFRRFDAVEPSPDMCEKLRTYVATLPAAQQRKIRIHQCGVGAEAATLRFDSTLGVGSCFSETGNIVVNVSTLDAIAGNAIPSLVIMDIEGAEYGALLGARGIIQTHRPVLAFCVYHTQNDLWRLPLLVHDMVPSYEMYLRTYCGGGFQAVAYAVPPERARKL
jgi:FkbM family methyltransferase